MITGMKKETKIVEYHFDLPMNAREIGDAIYQVDLHLGTRVFDDDYRVKSDGESLIFYWEVD